MGSDSIRQCVASLLLTVGASAAQAQQVVSQDVAGRNVTLVIPSGYCLLGRTSELGRDWYPTLEKFNEGRNKVLAIFASCSEAKRAEKDPNYFISSHGSYLAPFSKGQLTPLRSTETRASVLAEFKAGLPRISAQTPGRVEKRLAELDFDKELRMSGMHIGYLADDANAVYAGMGSWVEADNSKRRVLGVVGMTVLNRVVVSCNLYRDAGKEKGNFNALLAEQRSLMDQLAKNN